MEGKAGVVGITAERWVQRWVQRWRELLGGTAWHLLLKRGKHHERTRLTDEFRVQ